MQNCKVNSTRVLNYICCMFSWPTKCCLMASKSATTKHFGLWLIETNFITCVHMSARRDNFNQMHFFSLCVCVYVRLHWSFVFIVFVGCLVDRTGQYFHVFFASSAVVASAAVFLIVSFCWLDNRDKKLTKQGQPPTLLEPGKSPVDVVPGCQYSNLPTEGDKDKTPANGEFVTSVWASCPWLEPHGGPDNLAFYSVMFAEAFVVCQTLRQLLMCGWVSPHLTLYTNHLAQHKSRSKHYKCFALSAQGWKLDPTYQNEQMCTYNVIVLFSCQMLLIFVTTQSRCLIISSQDTRILRIPNKGFREWCF